MLSKCIFLRNIVRASCLLVLCFVCSRDWNMVGTFFTTFRGTWLPIATDIKTSLKWKVPLYIHNYSSPGNVSFLATTNSGVKGQNLNSLAFEGNKIALNGTHGRADTNRTKVTHIAFLKVHKAGSTTIQNMLFRFGIKHDLNILLPKKGNQLWSKADEMTIRKGQHYDIFAIHTVYFKRFFDTLLPADYVNIGIVREPLSRMISAAYYHRDVYHVKYLTRVPRANYIHNLINFPERYDRVLFSQTRNTMARDFGFSKWMQMDRTKLKKYLDELNFQFLFVMIMEKFDESLVYIRRLLNWSIADILYLKTNSHKHPPVVLSKTEKAKFRRTNSLDFDVFEYFSKVFDEKLKQVPHDFWEEVTYFKNLIKEVNLLCGVPKVTKPRTQLLSVDETKFNKHFNVTKTDCNLMKTPELLFIEQLRLRHHNKQKITS